MFQLDENFLKELGLDELPKEQKTAFLQHIYEELELRVGTKLAEGLTEPQMVEFEALIDRKEDKVRQWLETNMPNYKEADDFRILVGQIGPDKADDVAVLAEYSATKWLELNRPDYRQVVAAVLEELKGEITANRDHILGSSQS